MNLFHFMVVNANKGSENCVMHKVQIENSYYLGPIDLRPSRKNAESFLIINGGLNIIKTSLVTPGDS